MPLFSFCPKFNPGQLRSNVLSNSGCAAGQAIANLIGYYEFSDDLGFEEETLNPEPEAVQFGGMSPPHTNHERPG